MALPGRPAHLVRRFFGSLRRGGPAPGPEADLLRRLRDVEIELYRTLSVADRRHAVESASAAATLLREAAPDDHRDELVVAAALHDVGKLDAGLGTIGRATASLAAGILGSRLARLGERSALAARWATYADHPALGAERLAAMGCRDEVVTWAREHHDPPSESTLGEATASLLAAADDR